MDWNKLLEAAGDERTLCMFVCLAAAWGLVFLAWEILNEVRKD